MTEARQKAKPTADDLYRFGKRLGDRFTYGAVWDVFEFDGRRYEVCGENVFEVEEEKENQ